MADWDAAAYEAAHPPDADGAHHVRLVRPQGETALR